MSKASKAIKGVGGAIVVAIIAIFGMPFMGIGAASCMGYNDLVMGRLRSCPQAQQLLGDDIGPAYVGMSCGNAETEGSFGRASWSMPVRGSNGRGTYQFAAEKRGSGWQMLSGQLTANGQTVDILSCSGGGGGGGAVTAQVLQGTVATVTGTPPVPQGSQCTVAVTPVSGGQFNCRVQVQCAGQTVYGGGQSGFTNCMMQPGAAGGMGVVANDTGMTPADGDPSLALQGGNNTVMVSDQGAGGMWSINIATTPPAGAAAAVPAVPVTPGVPVPVPGMPTPGVPAPGVPVPGAVPVGVPGAAVPGASAWDGVSTLVCTGNQQVTLIGQTANLPGMRAITASGNCQLTIVNCTITAQDVITASGNSRVTITGGAITGSGTSIVASGNATVTVAGTAVEGRVRRSGGATLTGVE